MAHLSADGDIESVALVTPGLSGGGEEEVQVDADEDRRIIGWKFDVYGVSPGNDYDGDSRLFVGVDPGPLGSGTGKDIGGKLFDTSHYTADSTNGWSDAVNVGGVKMADNDHSFDWNEDVTLTLVGENDSANTMNYAATVYYVEA